MRKKSLGFYVIIIILGSVVGSVLGDIVGLLLPEGVVKQFFMQSAGFGVGPALFDLKVITFTLGFSLNINIIGVLGIFMVAYFLRWLD
ncbi:MAG: DUF4321 domain-containing protein [Calditrichaceae bacterium]|nr:DUF4321 domain-containing protein [Calditrichia bacterium]NUQ44046.1 DUF4321 domain-containing protein [Calditrichaceae bacterium]